MGIGNVGQDEGAARVELTAVAWGDDLLSTINDTFQVGFAAEQRVCDGVMDGHQDVAELVAVLKSNRDLASAFLNQVRAAKSDAESRFAAINGDPQGFERHAIDSMLASEEAIRDMGNWRQQIAGDPKLMEAHEAGYGDAARANPALADRHGGRFADLFYRVGAYIDRGPELVAETRRLVGELVGAMKGGIADRVRLLKDFASAKIKAGRVFMGELSQGLKSVKEAAVKHAVEAVEAVGETAGSAMMATALTGAALVKGIEASGKMVAEGAKVAAEAVGEAAEAALKPVVLAGDALVGGIEASGKLVVEGAKVVAEASTDAARAAGRVIAGAPDKVFRAGITGAVHAAQLKHRGDAYLAKLRGAYGDKYDEVTLARLNALAVRAVFFHENPSDADRAMKAFQNGVDNAKTNPDMLERVKRSVAEIANHDFGGPDNRPEHADYMHEKMAEVTQILDNQSALLRQYSGTGAGVQEPARSAPQRMRM